MAEFLSEKRFRDFQTGNCTDSYQFFGSRSCVRTVGGVRTSGIRFTLWAPGAAGVRVIGEFNDWGKNDTESGAMKRGKNGVWSFFTPDAAVGQKYK